MQHVGGHIAVNIGGDDLAACRSRQQASQPHEHGVRRWAILHMRVNLSLLSEVSDTVTGHAGAASRLAVCRMNIVSVGEANVHVHAVQQGSVMHGVTVHQKRQQARLSKAVGGARGQIFKTAC